MARRPRLLASVKTLRGSVLTIVLVTIALLGLLIPQLIRSNKLRNEVQNDFRSSEALDGVVNAVTSRAVTDVKSLFEAFTFTANAGWTNAMRFKPPKGGAFNKIYPKGDLSFIVELRRLDGTPFVPPLFMAPESDPRVWMDRLNAGGLGLNIFPMRISMVLCRQPIPRAIPTAATQYNLNLPWIPGCPIAQQVQVDKTILINSSQLTLNN